MTGGTDSAEYCYSVWLRHLVLGFRNKLCSKVPEVVAEFGPGDSIGIGLAALISGASRYIGLDVVEHSTLTKNAEIFDEIIELFKRKAPIPHGPEFDLVKPGLDSYHFPSEILTDAHMAKALSDERLKHIRKSILSMNRPGSIIQYVVPWTDADPLPSNSVDMIYSQAVMEYCTILPEAYHKMREWLKPDGFMSHQIDFKSHGTFDAWDGHWACSDLKWRLMRGKRPYFICRSTHSEHIEAIRDAGFKIILDLKSILPPTIAPGELNPRYRPLDPQDLTIAGAFVQARRL